jgi:asparagine synthase (glutamine-hydrolysing)
MYQGFNAKWRNIFLDAVKDCNGKLTWDPTAILAILDFNFTCGDRSLLNEINRQPWLSKIKANNGYKLEEIPKHGKQWLSIYHIAKNLENLLCSEAIIACSEIKEIYLLLSGGLDSRVVAGVLAKLYKEDKLVTNPIAVTWGLENSRDVYYGRMIAKILGFEWQHLNIGPEDVVYNIEKMSNATGSLVSPMDLHCMHWFRNVSSEALVLAASYGDSIGRAEYSGQHLLELNFLQPVNAFKLINDDVLPYAYKGLIKDLKSLHDRSSNQPKYVICEHEQQGHYMRNMIGHAMSSTIGQYCSIYQMFTHPSLYSYIWSIHPALRSDDIYVELLNHLDSRLIKIPWTRTNRALKGKTIDVKSELFKEFHNYSYWISGSLFYRLNKYINPDWFADTGIFNRDSIKSLSEKVRLCNDKKLQNSIRICQIWLWLAAFRCIAEHLERLGKSVKLDTSVLKQSETHIFTLPKTRNRSAKQILSRVNFIYDLYSRYQKTLKKMRRNKLKRQVFRKNSP